LYTKNDNLNLHTRFEKKVGRKMSKKKFEVFENESINDCLDRMKSEGYTPIKRMEEPIFKEVIQNGTKEIEPAGRKIVFEGKQI
jgi:hypothetical protein